MCETSFRRPTTIAFPLGERGPRAHTGGEGGGDLAPQRGGEGGVVRRGGDGHVKVGPGHAARAQYGEATALEALLGWLYLQGRRERISQLFHVMMEE